MKKQILKRLVLSRETLCALSAKEAGLALGANATAMSMCKDMCGGVIVSGTSVYSACP